MWTYIFTYTSTKQDIFNYLNNYILLVEDPLLYSSYGNICLKVFTPFTVNKHYGLDTMAAMLECPYYIPTLKCFNTQNH